MWIVILFNFVLFFYYIFVLLLFFVVVYYYLFIYLLFWLDFCLCGLVKKKKKKLFQYFFKVDVAKTKGLAFKMCWK